MALPLIPIAIGLGVAWWVSKNKQGAGTAPSGSTPQDFTDPRDFTGWNPPSGGGNVWNTPIGTDSNLPGSLIAKPGPVYYEPPSTMYPTPKAADTGGTGIVSTQTGLTPTTPVAVSGSGTTLAGPTTFTPVATTTPNTVTAAPTISAVSAPTIGGVPTSYNTVNSLSSSSQYLIDQMKQAQQQQYQTALASYQNFGFK